jgi:hypothetical protein
MSTEEGKGEETQYPTTMQVFALSYLYTEESKQRQKEGFLDSQRLRTHSSHSSVLTRPISVPLRNLCNIIPPSMILQGLTAERALNELMVLVQHGYLEQEFRNRPPEYASFSITSNGMLLIKQYLAGLSNAIKDEQITEQHIERAQGDNVIKQYFKELMSKVKDRTQDEIVDALFSAIKTHGIKMTIMLVSLLT